MLKLSSLPPIGCSKNEAFKEKRKPTFSFGFSSFQRKRKILPALP